MTAWFVKAFLASVQFSSVQFSINSDHHKRDIRGDIKKF